MPTVVKMGIILGIEICEHGGSLEGKHLMLLDHGKSDFKFERGNFEKLEFLAFFIKKNMQTEFFINVPLVSAGPHYHGPM